MTKHPWIRYVIAGAALVSAYARWEEKTFAPENVDATILTLIITAALALILPWERLRHFKAGDVEIQLDQPSIQGALTGMLDAQPQQIKELLNRLASKLEQARGGRVLWIEDKPHNVVGERRFLRALGIDVVTAMPDITDPGPILKTIEEDNDFDLIISDVQWLGESNNATYGGMQLIKKLRDQHDDPVIRALPVIFYTAYTPAQLEDITRSAGMERALRVEYCHSIESLVRQTIVAIAETRSNPIKVGKKRPT